MKKFLVLLSGILLASSSLFAETKLIAVGDIAVGEGLKFTPITGLMLEINRPDLMLGCTLNHAAVSYPRVIKAGSKFLIKKVGIVSQINWATAPLPEVKKQIERLFSSEIKGNIETRAELDKLLREKFGIEPLRGTTHIREFMI